MIQIEFDDRQLSELRRSIEKAPDIVQDELMRWGWDTGARLQEQVLQRTPSRTGTLRNSIQAGLSVAPLNIGGTQALGSLGVERLPGDRIGVKMPASGGVGVSVVIGSNETYAPWVELGTKPHKIKARNAKALAFHGATGTVFAKEVNHPGTPAVRMFGDALDASEAAIRASVGGLLERIIARVFGGQA